MARFPTGYQVISCLLLGALAGCADPVENSDHIVGNWKTQVVADGRVPVGEGYFVFEAPAANRTGVWFEFLVDADGDASGVKKSYELLRTTDEGRSVEFRSAFGNTPVTLYQFEILDSRSTQAVLTQRAGTNTSMKDALHRLVDQTELTRVRGFVECARNATAEVFTCN